MISIIIIIIIIKSAGMVRFILYACQAAITAQRFVAPTIHFSQADSLFS